MVESANYQEEWFNRLFGDGRTLVNRPVTPEEVKYLSERMPFLQIICANPGESFDTQLSTVASSTGWSIHVYGTVAMSASLGQQLWGRYIEALNFQDPAAIQEAEKAVQEALSLPTGTVYAQADQVAEEMMQLAKRLWPEGASVVGGTRRMSFSAWVASQSLEYSLDGVSVDMAMEQQYRMISEKLGQRLEHIRTAPGLALGA